MYSKILLATDGSAHAAQAAKYVRDLLKLNPDAEATLIYVEHINREYHVYRTFEVELPVNEEAIKENVEKNIMEKARSVFTEAGLSVDSKVAIGNAPEVICETAANGCFDLIVMGSRGLSELKGFLLGSVSDRVLHLAQCPVLIVK